MRELKNILRQIKEAKYIGIHAGNYGLRHYLSAEQKRCLEDALNTALRIEEADSGESQ